MKAPSTGAPASSVSTCCHTCVAGPDLMTVTVEDGVATAIRPNFNAKEHPAKGRGEEPGFVPITWEEALKTIVGKELTARLHGAGIPLVNDVGRNVRDHGGVQINAAAAAKLGIADGDLVEVRSVTNVTHGKAIVVGIALTVAGWFVKVTIVLRAARSNGFAVAHTPVRGRGTSRAGDRPGRQLPQKGA